MRSHQNRLIENTQYTIFNIKRKIDLNFFKSAAIGFFSKGLKNEFETAMVNESSVFEPLKFHCMYKGDFGFKDRICVTLNKQITVLSHFFLRLRTEGWGSYFMLPEHIHACKMGHCSQTWQLKSLVTKNSMFEMHIC